MLAFGKDGCSKALDAIHRYAGNAGHIFEALAGPDPRLNITGGEGGLHLDLQLSEPRPIAPYRSAESFVRLDDQFLAALGDHDQGLPIGAESHQSCGAHQSRGSSYGVCSQPTYSASPTKCGTNSAQRARQETWGSCLGSYCRSMREPFQAKGSGNGPATRGEIQASGYLSRRMKAELRDNLLQRLRSGTKAFPGIVGFDETVLPELESAVLAGHALV